MLGQESTSGSAVGSLNNRLVTRYTDVWLLSGIWKGSCQDTGCVLGWRGLNPDIGWEGLQLSSRATSAPQPRLRLIELVWEAQRD